MKPCRKFSPADRPDLAGAERARDRERPEQLVDHAGVVVGHAEEPAAAAVAREEQRGLGLDAAEQLAQVLVGGRRVADVELHRLADGDVVADDDRARGLVAAEHVAHEEVAAAEVGLVLVDDDAEVQAGTHERPVLLARLGGGVLHAVRSRRARRAPRSGCARRASRRRADPPDGSPGTRRCARRRPSTNTPTAPDGVITLAVEDEAVAAGAARRRGRATDHLDGSDAIADRVVVQPAEEAVDREAERVGEEEAGSTGRGRDRANP